MAKLTKMAGNLIPRRKWLSYAIVLGGPVARSLAWNSDPGNESLPIAQSIDQGLWSYHYVDPLLAQKIAYRNHLKGGCCYAVFSGILLLLAEKYGDPYKGFPLKMMEYGMAGVGGHGSLCGSVNGGAAAIGLFHSGALRESLIKQLLQWYESTELPIYKPEQALSTNAEIPGSIAKSVLCRDSLGAWSKESGLKWGREQRERCARLDADVVRKTAELLNSQLENIAGKTAAGA